MISSRPTPSHPPPPPATNTVQVYFVVALLRVAQSRVVDASSAGLDLSPLLLEGEALEGFQLEASLGFMEDLEQRHRPRCLAATQAFLARVAG